MSRDRQGAPIERLKRSDETADGGRCGWHGRRTNDMTMLQSGEAAAPSVVKDTTTQTFVKDVIEESKRQPVLVDFWAEWCGPCKQLGPVLEKVVRAAKGKVKLVKMDIDKHPTIPGQLGIQSIPAVFAVTRDPFLVCSSNVFAVLGLRSLYFALAGMLERFAYLRYGLAAILVAVGVKMLVSDLYHVPVAASLGVIALILALSIAVSLCLPSISPLPLRELPGRGDS